jgi:hypothetical protein
MIQKTFKIICDNCCCGINDYFEYPKGISFKKDSIIVSKRKHFCCKKCKEEYFKKNELEVGKKWREVNLF